MVVAVAVPVYAFYYYMRDAFSNHFGAAGSRTGFWMAT